MDFDFKKEIETCLPQAVESLKQAMREGGPNMLKAAEIVLNYTQGKPEEKGGKNNNVTVNLVNFRQDENGNIISTAETQAISHRPAVLMPQEQYITEPIIEEY